MTTNNTSKDTRAQAMAKYRAKVALARRQQLTKVAQYKLGVIDKSSKSMR